jgi:hypothetical protein
MPTSSQGDADPPQKITQESADCTPRAQRFPIETPMRYRQGGQMAWSEGATVNISRSGVLFRAEQEIEPKTMLEMRITFPSEITGSVPANIGCWGPVIRKASINPPETQPVLAAAIVKYRFTHG